jgi:hypothetical protein
MIYFFSLYSGSALQQQHHSKMTTNIITSLICGLLALPMLIVLYEASRFLGKVWRLLYTYRAEHLKREEWRAGWNAERARELILQRRAYWFIRDSAVVERRLYTEPGYWDDLSAIVSVASLV